MDTKELRTLERVIRRDDYSRLSVKLAEKTEEFAKIVRKKMKELEIENFNLKGLYFKICKRKTRSGHCYQFLGNEYEKSYEDDESYYFVNDYNCYVEANNNKEKLNFLNSIKDIFNYLDEVETEKSKEIEDALEKVKDL